ncbi:quinate 5-dehydrogenase [Selenomonadales bacterium OttesenSCG-928-I06]|nr:quinate 5-dehydrogenase [Selenomonadales bacterium OttesenSCG-928-I06]
MKKVVSISLGSSKRDSKIETEFGGELFLIQRIGVDGDRNRAIELFKSFDGKVDVLTLGGTDLYIYAGNKRYTFSQTQKITSIVKKTPLVDGSGIKNTLERRVIPYLESNYEMNFSNKKILLVCAVDRFGLAETFAKRGADMVFGDLMFGLKIPVPIRTLKKLDILARIIGPVVTKLPIEMFYPTGEKQTENKPIFSRFFKDADIIAGDFHFIRRYIPTGLDNKIIITNTVTAEDEVFLKEKGIKTLITTTPEIGGRSFGANVLEGILVALKGDSKTPLSVKDYNELLDKLEIKPRVKQLL